MKFFTTFHIPQFTLRYRLVGAILAVIFVSVSFLLVSTGVMNTMMGAMSHCPYMDDGQGMCPMTIADHVRSWTAMFSVTVPTVFGVISLVLMLARVVLTHVEAADPHTWRLKLFRHAFQDAETPAKTYLRQLFRSGILNPKIFPIAE